MFHLTENSEEPRTDMKLRIQRPHWPALLRLAGSLVFAAAAAAASAPDQNWPQWRGPLQNGVAPTANPPTTWSETNNVKWKVKIPGSGQATPIIWDNRVFIQTAIPTGKKAEAKPAEASEQPPASSPRARRRTAPDRDRADRVARAEERAGRLWRRPQADGSLSVRGSVPGPSDGQSALAAGGPRGGSP